jgi:DNA-binding response OmpR family regulator
MGQELHALLVEDDKLLSWALAQSFTRLGFTVQAAFSGREALCEFSKGRFDVIVLDYQLPDNNGLDLARSFRGARPGSVIFLLTAVERRELEIEDGLIDAYFNKTDSLKALYASVAALVENGKVGLPSVDTSAENRSSRS